MLHVQHCLVYGNRKPMKTIQQERNKTQHLEREQQVKSYCLKITYLYCRPL